jgi:hypothetical protein
MEQYFNPEGEVTFPFPSRLIPNRFTLDAEDRLHFHGRESLKTLFDRVNKFLCQPYEVDFYYVGTIGAGKSHNLAALVHILRNVPHTSPPSIPVIYVSNFGKLNENLLKYMISVLSESLPEASGVIDGLKSLEDIIDFFDKQELLSLLFVYDDWNYCVSSEAPMDEKESRQHCYKFFNAIAAGQYCIRAVSAGSYLAKPFSGSNPPIRLELNGGLTPREWRFWKSRSTCSVVRNLVEGSEYDIRIADFTGLIPLNIKNFEETVVPPGTVDIIQYKMDHFAGIRDIERHIREYSDSIREPTFQAYHFALMMDSLAGRSNTIGNYDCRYFFTQDCRVVPVSGLVRKLEANYLAIFKSDEFHSELTPGFKSSGKSVQGFNFEQYCLSKIYRFPSFLIPNLVSPCSIVYFKDLSELVLGESECTLFWPKNYWYPKVDAVLRHANPDAKSTKIIAIKVTLQDPIEHQQTLEFF